jgi:hypothetical protein
MNNFIKDLTLLGHDELEALFQEESRHESHQAIGMRVRLLHVLAARSVTVNGNGERTGIFSVAQESEFARLQIKLNSLVSLPSVAQESEFARQEMKLNSLVSLPLLHLTPRLLLIDEKQHANFLARIGDARQRLVGDLLAQESNMQKAKVVAKQPPATTRASNPPPAMPPFPLPHQDLFSEDVASLISSFSLRLAIGSSDDGESEDWLTVGRKQQPQPPPQPQQQQTQQTHIIKQPQQQKQNQVLEEENVVAQQPEQTKVEPKPTQPSVAMVTKEKYNQDLRELRIVFEERIQLLQMRIITLQHALEVANEKLAGRL